MHLTLSLRLQRIATLYLHPHRGEHNKFINWVISKLLTPQQQARVCKLIGFALRLYLLITTTHTYISHAETPLHTPSTRRRALIFPTPCKYMQHKSQSVNLRPECESCHTPQCNNRRPQKVEILPLKIQLYDLEIFGEHDSLQRLLLRDM